MTKESWHLDKRVPLSLIMVIIFQTFGLIVWGTNLHADVRSNKQAIQVIADDHDGMQITRGRQYQLIRENEARDSQMRERLAAVEATLKNIDKNVQHLVDRIEK